MAAGAPAPESAPEQHTDEPPEEPMPGEGVELEVLRDQAAHQQIVTRELPTDGEIRRMWRLASALAASGMFKDTDQAAQAFAKILMGHDLGLTPAQSMSGIHIVEGNPQLHYSVIGGFVRAHEGYDYRVGEHTAESCTVTFTRNGEVIGESTFTMDDARLLLGESKVTKSTGNWVRQPKVMLLARALSQGVRWYMPEVLGGVPVYSWGEIEPGSETRRIAASGEPEGIELGPKVEEVLIRANSLGHKGIADRASAEMALGDQPPQVVDRWVQWAHGELDVVDEELCRDASEDGRLCVLPTGHEPPHKARAGEPWESERADVEPAEGEDGDKSKDPEEEQQRLGEEPAGG